ncbi:MAG: V-type ATPase subunit [Candidatus Krumholzibacteria bacterium]|nr:V-type ATPase subunit [Candidatus Krumholzibacteria bacterium]
MAEDYTYIVARLRSLEALSPERAWFERLARTPGENLLGALREHYRGFEAVSSPAEFERALEIEKRSFLELVTGLLQDERARQFIRSGYDFDNCTHAWKAAKLGARVSLTPFGLFPARDVEETVAGKARGVLSPSLEAHLAALDARYEETKSLAACEYAGEAAKWRFLFEIAPGEDAAAYLGCRIDLINVKNCIRFRRSALRAESLDAVWIEGGGIETARFRSFVREGEEELLSYLATSMHARLARLGLSRDVPLWKIDPIMRRALMEFLGESRYRFFDFSPVLYHIELGERDFETVRRIVVSRLNRLSEETTLERLGVGLAS